MQLQGKKQKNIQDLDSVGDLYAKIQQSLLNGKEFKIGNFIILQRLGKGTYGQVYKALHSINQKYFAIKIIDKQKIFKTVDQYVKQVLKRLLQSEGLLMQLCDSPYVLKCYDIIQNDRYKIFILQYCNRQSLHQQLEKRKAFPLNQALAIFKQIINGLAVINIIIQKQQELHKKNIIHRDLKPQNIMINNGSYKIADFGFCKKIQYDNIIGNFTVLGTRTTMAPEVKNRQKYGIKADVWSLGIIFYTMICSNINYNSQRFTGRSNDINKQIKKGKQIYFQTVNGSPNQQLKNFILSMLKRNQNERISWQQLKNHPIFNQSNNIYINPVLNPQLLQSTDKLGIIQDSFIQIFENNLPTEQDLMRKKQLDRISKDQIKDKNKIKQIQVEEQIRKQLNQIIHIQITQMKAGFKIDFQIKSDTDQQRYQQIQKNNLQCLKAMYIYENIILQLQKMLDLNKRTNYQLLYLLINRCYINVSWSNNHLKIFHDDDMFVNFHTQILQLYNKIKKKWQYIDQKLLLLSNPLKEKLKDFKNFIFRNQQQNNLNIYFGGIENIDYEKQRQIQYTQNYYIQKILDQLKGQPNVLYEIKNKLRCYKKINQIQLKDLQQIDFYEKVKKILLKGA